MCVCLEDLLTQLADLLIDWLPVALKIWPARPLREKQKHLEVEIACGWLLRRWNSGCYVLWVERFHEIQQERQEKVLDLTEKKRDEEKSEDERSGVEVGGRTRKRVWE